MHDFDKEAKQNAPAPAPAAAAAAPAADVAPPVTSTPDLPTPTSMAVDL